MAWAWHGVANQFCASRSKYTATHPNYSGPRCPVGLHRVVFSRLRFQKLSVLLKLKEAPVVQRGKLLRDLFQAPAKRSTRVRTKRRIGLICSPADCLVEGRKARFLSLSHECFDVRAVDLEQ